MAYLAYFVFKINILNLVVQRMGNAQKEKGKKKSPPLPCKPPKGSLDGAEEMPLYVGVSE